MKKKQRIWQKAPLFRINNKIFADQVRVVGEDIEQGVYSLADAIALAASQGLDLVEISPNAKPPVCRITDYRKFLYDKKKKEKEIKSKAIKTVIKEIRFTPHTDDHDFEFKLKHAEKFLKDSAKVKAYVQFRGRAIIFKEQGETLLLKFALRLEEIGVVEQHPKLEGKRMIMMIAPLKSRRAT